MTEEKMLSRTQDGVGYIIFNNPEKHNAVSIEMWDALEKFLNKFREDNHIRVVVLEVLEVNHLFLELTFPNLIKKEVQKKLY